MSHFCDIARMRIDVSFWANRTLSRDRRMTGSDPQQIQARLQHLQRSSIPPRTSSQRASLDPFEFNQKKSKSAVVHQRPFEVVREIDVRISRFNQRNQTARRSAWGSFGFI
jgi:hypothetical protein